jgi:hypothetical protein
MRASSSLMDPQFEELAQRVADDVEKRFSKRFDEAEKRLEGVIVGRLDDAEEGLAQTFEGAETRLSKQFADAEKRLSDGARMHMEDLKTTVTVVAEGYGATLDRIERRLTELNTN